VRGLCRGLRRVRSRAFLETTSEGGGGMRGMGSMVTGTMNRQKASAQEFLNNRAGSTLNAALYKNSAGDVRPTATP